ncbi:hypothetical protein GCM10027168_23270 [Streptomyces capparidis]
MTTQHTTKARTRLAASALVVGLAFAVAGCGGDGDGDGDDTGGKPKATASTSADPGSGGDGGDGSEAPEPVRTLAEVKGEKDMVLTITEATRDSGGFVTVKGQVTNRGDKIFNATRWTGLEQEVQKSGPSVAGAVLVDLKDKKRYYVLRDTEGVCLCTRQLSLIKPGETRPVYAQFPAPPEGVTEVGFELPTMPPATITISG